MGNDRDTRKQAKKKWKKLGRLQAETMLADEKAQRRERKKRKGRRLCQGMCYKMPGLSEEDKKWNGKVEDDSDAEVPSDVEEEVQAERQRSHAAASASNAAESADGAGSMLDKKQEKKQKSKAKAADKGKDAVSKPLGIVKLSTGVQLLDPTVALNHASAQAKQQAQAKADGMKVVEPEALKPYPPLIQSFMVSQGFVEPTPIQAAAWPACCSGQDFQGVAEPGSGKTLAYLLPGIVRLQAAGHSGTTNPEGPAMLVLAPTRELALQVATACRLVRKLTGLRTVCVYGGVPKEQQVELLGKHPHILVGTPGRILDLVDDGALKLTPAGSSYVVLDEADKMLSLGFQPQLDRLRALLLPAAAAPPAELGKPGKKAKAAGAAAGGGGAAAPRPQVLLFTATMPAEVKDAAAKWLAAKAAHVTITHSAASISRTITQVVQVCAEHKKPAKLLKHLAAIKAKAESAQLRNLPRVLVFANRIKTVRFLADTLKKEGYKAVMLHGERSQPEREAAMSEFKAGKAQVMVATDVAARGLDIRLLPYVVNYDFPSSLETYIHRVGRTGRLAAYGHAYSFFTRNLARIAGPLVDLLSAHEQGVDPLLVQLADAWKVAEAQLGPEALAKAAAQAGSEDGEEEAGRVEDDPIDMRMEVDDLMEGLGGSQAAKLKQQQVLAAQKAAKRKLEAAQEGQAKKAQKGEEQAGPGFKARLERQKVAGVDAAQAKETAAGPAFIASAKWKGAKPGYAFKKGPQGQGYYVDRPPKKSGPKQPVYQRGKGPIIGGPMRTNIFDSDSDEDAPPSKQQQQATKAKPASAPAGAGRAAVDGKGKKKPLPGRLRKKLAKEKAQGDGSP